VAHGDEPLAPVILWSTEAEWIERGNGIRTRYLATTDAGATAFLTGITEFDEKAFLPFHSHNCEESVVVLEGSAIFETEGEEFEIDANDTTIVPTAIVHRFVNRGQGRLRILWIYGSTAATRTLADTGKTVPIGSVEDRHW